MLKRTTQKLLIFSAYVSLLIGIIGGLLVLTLAVMFYVGQKDLNISKIFIVDTVIILIALAVFFFFFGIYELLKHCIVVEKELEEVEEEIKIIKDK